MHSLATGARADARVAMSPVCGAEPSCGSSFVLRNVAYFQLDAMNSQLHAIIGQSRLQKDLSQGAYFWLIQRSCVGLPQQQSRAPLTNR